MQGLGGLAHGTRALFSSRESRVMGEVRSPARLVRLVAALLVALSFVAAYGATTASAADRNFAPRFTANDTGDVDIFGNTLMTCPAAASGCAAAQQSGVTTTADATSQNNAYNMQYIDVDGDASTFNSSRSTVDLPSGSTVLFAGLYWGARTLAGTGGSNARNAALRGNVKFRAPGDSGYTALTASTLDDGTGGIYQGFVDVTDRVKAAGDGQYTVADVQASTGADTLAGWSLVIAYRDTSQPARNLSVFDGIKSISASASGTINVSGFTTPPAGAVKTRVGFVTYEGDGGIVGDSASLNGTVLSDAQHPATNFFNSRSSRDGVRRTATEPNYPNQLGIEQSILMANGILGNNATSATIGLTSSGDVYAPGVVTFATELYAPKIEQTKTVTDDNGGDVEQGDTLTYTIAGKNTGQDGAANFVLRDPLPANTAYVPGSLKVTQPGGSSTTVTDGADTDTGEYDAASRRVVTRLGTGANVTAGGTIAPDASYATTFKVKVGSDAVDGTVLTNIATSTFSAQTLRTTLTASSSVSSRVTAPQVAGLAVSKSASSDQALTGDVVTYTLRASNAGPAAARDTVVTDTLPAGTMFVAADAPCTNAGGKVSCALGTIAAGSSRTVTIKVKVAAIDPSLDGRAAHQIDVTKIESNLAIPASSSGTATATCPSGYVATDGSVRLDSVDQGTGTFAGATVLSSGGTANGTGWNGKVVNGTTGQLQAKVNVVCVTRRTTTDGGHQHSLLVSDPVETTRRWTAGSYDVTLTCGPGRVVIAPSYAFDGNAAVRGSKRSGTGWTFTVDVPESTVATFSISCLSTAVSVANGHTHDLGLSQISDQVDTPAGKSVTKRLSCGDGKGIVGSVDFDKGLVNRGNDPQPVNRDFSIYNPTGSTLAARFGLLCLDTRTGGEHTVKDIVNTANVTTTTPDATTSDDSSTATFRASSARAVQTSSGASASASGSSGASVSPRVAVVAVAKKVLRLAGTAAKPTVLVTLTCAKGVACDGRAQLVATSKVKGTKIKRGGILASATVKIKAGRKATVRLKAKKGAAAKALRRGKVKKAKVVVTTDGSRVARTVTLRRR